MRYSGTHPITGRRARRLIVELVEAEPGSYPDRYTVRDRAGRKFDCTRGALEFETGDPVEPVWASGFWAAEGL